MRVKMWMGLPGPNSRAHLCSSADHFAQRLRQPVGVASKYRITCEPAHLERCISEIGDKLLRILPLDAQCGVDGWLDRVGMRDFNQNDLLTRLPHNVSKSM